MRKQLLEQLNIKKIFVAGILLLSITSACKRKGVEKISEDLSSKPTIEIIDFERTQSEKGKLKNRLKADLLENYGRADTPYYLFPKGIEAFTYNDSSVLETEMIADSAVFKESINFFEARGNIVITNHEKNMILVTDGPLFWDSEKQLMYTYAYSKVIRTPDTIIALEGLTANQDFTSYELRKGRDGVTYVNAESDSTENTENGGVMGLSPATSNDTIKKETAKRDSLETVIKGTVINQVNKNDTLGEKINADTSK